MATLTHQIDRFVRWFFNSSPDKSSIEPPPRSVAAKTPAAGRSTAATKPRPGPERRSLAAGHAAWVGE